MALHYAELREGHSFGAVVVEALTRTQIVMYAGASGDFNPVHHDEVFAQESGYPSVFAHGMLTMGLTGRMLTDTVGDGRLVKFGGRFVAQVWPGDTLTVRAVVEQLREVDGQRFVDLAINTTNQSGTDVFTGHASAIVD